MQYVDIIAAIRSVRTWELSVPHPFGQTVSNVLRTPNLSISGAGEPDADGC